MHFCRSKCKVTTFFKYSCCTHLTPIYVTGLTLRAIFLIAHQTNMAAIIIEIPKQTEICWAGTAIFISLTTPERDVYVVEPVKFIAKCETMEGKSSR